MRDIEVHFIPSLLEKTQKKVETRHIANITVNHVIVEVIEMIASEQKQRIQVILPPPALFSFALIPRYTCIYGVRIGLGKGRQSSA